MEHADSDTNIKQSKSNHLGKLALICSPWNRTIVYRSQRFCPDTSFSLYHQENTPGAMENQTSCFQRFQLNFILSGSVHRRSFLCRQRQYRRVSTAVLAGGLGAIFWMWVAAFVGMATKYGEIILGLLYRVKNEDGTYSGGPMYYIRDGLHAPVLASLCAFSW